MTTVDAPAEPADALAQRLVAAAVGALELDAIHLGRRLGLYELLADGAARTSAELASAAGIAERYAREWCEQQAVAGLLDASAAPEASERAYRLPAAHVPVLVDAEDPRHVAPLATMLAGVGQTLPEVVAAYRSGAGVGFERYGPDLRDGQGAVNRPAFTSALVTDWIPAAGTIGERLRAGARVADVGCGLGWSTATVAAAFPDSRVVGVDLDTASVRAARRLHADVATERLSFAAADARWLDELGRFDVILVLESLHDAGDPLALLAGLRRACADDGAVLVMDERVAPTFTAPGDLVERMMYGWSVTHCLPAALADGDHGATGTAIRPGTVIGLAEQAGFGRAQVLVIEDELFRGYLLEP